jgi:hypothetical protein
LRHFIPKWLLQASLRQRGLVRRVLRLWRLLFIQVLILLFVLPRLVQFQVQRRLLQFIVQVLQLLELQVFVILWSLQPFPQLSPQPFLRPFPQFFLQLSRQQLLRPEVLHHLHLVEQLFSFVLLVFL